MLQKPQNFSLGLRSLLNLSTKPLAKTQSKKITNKNIYALAPRRLKNFTLNFGPQHPAAHGILRILLQMSGEVIQQADAQFGLLHRGSEKLSENRTLLQTLPYFDRFDYVANFFQEHAYCLAVENAALNKDIIPFEVLACRTLFDEFSRVANHLLTLSAVTMDMGAMASMFWAFEEREQLMEFFERASGARMHTALYKPFSFDSSALNTKFLLDIASFLRRSGRALSGAFLGLLNNRALKSRYSNIGLLTTSKLNAYGISGILLRSAGVASDLRLNSSSTWGAYSALSFKTFLGRKGDNYDRFILRVKETVESFRIIAQLLTLLTSTKKKSITSVNSLRFKLSFYKKSNKVKKHRFGLQILLKLKKLTARKPTYITTKLQLNTKSISARGRFSGMEELISHFKVSSDGFSSAPGISYGEVESPKGLVGVFLVTNGSSRPVRMKLRTPVAHNLNLIPAITPGSLFADFVATFCSLDVVLGEIDR